MALSKEVWKDLEEHPAWKELVSLVQQRIQAKTHELEEAAYRGEIIQAARYSAEIKILRWFLDLPKTQRAQQPK